VTEIAIENDQLFSLHFEDNGNFVLNTQLCCDQLFH